jgi:receptor-type tyrosine-protein phosphatase N
MNLFLSTTGQNRSSEPVHHDHEKSARRSTLYYVMTSSEYCGGSLAFIVLLLVFIGILGYLYYRLRKKGGDRYIKTVRYAPVSQRESEDERGVFRKRPLLASHGLAYDVAPRYTPSVSNTQTATVPVSPHMDITAGHLLLSYIEENLKNRHKLRQEWESLQSYIPEGCTTKVATLTENKPKNRYPDALPYDQNRVKLDPTKSVTGSDYINASYIIDVDPHHPRYIATQGPLSNTIDDFWQMVWERDITAIVMLTQVTDMGLSQSSQYWPSNGVATYNIYEVRLVSEHPHSEDYIIRSFYLQNSQTRESRTVTHFQCLTWTSLGAPPTATPLLEFRRKVNRACSNPKTPLLVHCSGGVGRTGTYMLIDMALSRIQSGAKEINLAASVEYLRDHRPHMVKTKV